jgi:hypothetical protein
MHSPKREEYGKWSNVTHVGMGRCEDHRESFCVLEGPVAVSFLLALHGEPPSFPRVPWANGASGDA